MPKSNRISRKARLWMDFYFGQASFNATEAARLANFKNPSSAGPYLMQKYSQVLDARMDALRESRIAKPMEILEIWSDISRDKDHRDQVKASELLARAHGMLSEKLDIRVSRADLVKDLTTTLATISASVVKMIPESTGTSSDPV